MDSACWLQEEDQEKKTVIIVLACSDALLRLLVWQSDKLSLQDEAAAGDHCLLQVDFYLANKSIRFVLYQTTQVQKCEGTDTVLTGSTGGELVVWKATKGRLTSLAKLGVHQSGVNCLQVGIRNED